MQIINKIFYLNNKLNKKNQHLNNPTLFRRKMIRIQIMRTCSGKNTFRNKKRAEIIYNLIENFSLLFKKKVGVIL